MLACQTPEEEPGQHTTRSTPACTDNENNDSGNAAEPEAAWLEDIFELLTNQDPDCDNAAVGSLGTLAGLTVPVLPAAATLPAPGAGATLIEPDLIEPLKWGRGTCW